MIPEPKIDNPYTLNPFDAASLLSGDDTEQLQASGWDSDDVILDAGFGGMRLANTIENIASEGAALLNIAMKLMAAGGGTSNIVEVAGE